MPAKNIVKTYYAGGYYHVYNRGVEKRSIFLDDQDCNVFLRYIKLYLSPKESIDKLAEKEIKVKRFTSLNLEKEVDLVCFALMPNHFHLLLKNKSTSGIKTFMQRLTTAYVMYFNKKYGRVGPLFQNIYKASHVAHDSYMLHLSRYIHNNSLKINVEKIKFANYNSNQYYIGLKKADWLKPEIILSYFQNFMEPKNIVDSYKKFVEMDIADSNALLASLDLTLDESCS